MLTRDLSALDSKIANLTTAIEGGAAVAPLVAKLHERQTERDALVAEIAAAKAVQDLTLDRKAIEQDPDEGSQLARPPRRERLRTPAISA